MRKGIRSWFVLAVLAAAGLNGGLPASVQAYDLVDEEDFELDINGLGEVQAGTSVGSHGGAGQAADVQVNMARLAAAARYPERGGVKVQVEAASGSVELLDAAAFVAPTDFLAVKAGRFKVPVSEEYMTSAGDMLFSRRAALTGLVPHRAIGVQTGVEFTTIESDTDGHGEHEEGTRAVFQAGGFLPPGDEAGDRGALMMGRAKVEFPSGIGMHAAFAEHAFAPNSNLETDERVMEDDRLLDAALSYHHHRWHGLVEGTVALDGAGDSVPWGLHGSLARRFRTGGPQLEPAVAYDVVERESTAHRATAALNIYWLDTRLMSTVEYEAEFEHAEAEHAFTMLLQAGF